MSSTDPLAKCVLCGTETSSPRCPKCGGALRAGAYRVEGLLGQTPHSRTYAARDESGKRVALKELLFANVPTLQQLEAFEREARLLAAVDHPQVPRFLASFQEGTGSETRLYLAQELVEGTSLWERLRSGTFDEAQARDVALQVLTVLEHLHGRVPPVIHRDIKPHNLIARPDGKLALVDFGAARELASGATHQATLVGTYGYMPPDQLAGSVDQTSDLYALGATLMHLLTSKPPDKLVNESLELSEGVALNVSPGFDKLVRRLAAKVPSKRFPSAQAALEALAALPPLSKAKGGRRSALVAAAAVLVLAAAGAGIGVMRRTPATTPVSEATPGIRAWTWEPKVVLYEAAISASAMPPGGALPIGVELRVERLPAAAGDGGPAQVEFVKVLAPVAAFVRASDIRFEAPDYGQIFETARSALGEARLQEAETEAARAHALRVKEREPLALLAALYDAQSRADDARRVAQQLAELGPPPPPAASAKVEPRTGPLPAAGQRWFVGASRLRIRKKPNADGAVLADLTINTQVEVREVAGDWAKVEWAPSQAASLELSLEEGKESAPPAPAPVQGWVAHAYLVHDQVDKPWTLTKADAAEAQGDPAEGVRQLGRAAALDPTDRALQLRLAKAAVRTRDYPTAAYAAVAANELEKGQDVPLVELKLAAGCRGQRQRAEWLDDVAAASEHAPEDACVETFTAAECPPCDCGSGYYEEFEKPQEMANRRRQLQEEGVSEEEIERRIDEEFNQTSHEPSEGERWQAQEGQRVQIRSAVTAAYKDGPWLRVRVTGPARAVPGARVIVYAFSAREEMKTEGIEGEEQTTTCVSREVSVRAIDASPVPLRGQDVTLWVKVPEYEATYGVAFSPSVHSVRQELERDYARCGAGEPPNSISGTSSEAYGCEECQCT